MGWMFKGERACVGRKPDEMAMAAADGTFLLVPPSWRLAEKTGRSTENGPPRRALSEPLPGRHPCPCNGNTL